EINKTKSKFDNYSFTLNLLYLDSISLDENLKNNSKIFNMIEKYKICNLKLSKSLKYFDEILVNYNNPSYTKLNTLVSKLSIFKNTLSSNINYLIENKNIFYDNFNLVTINCAYEAIFKSNITQFEII